MSLAIFDDEMKIETHTAPKKSWTLKSEKRKSFTKHKHPLKLNVWAAISLNGKTRLSIFKENMDSSKYVEIIKSQLIPFLKKNFTKN